MVASWRHGHWPSPKGLHYIRRTQQGGDKVTILRLATWCVTKTKLLDNGSASSQRRSLDSLRASVPMSFKPSLACSPLIIAWLNHLLLVKLPPKSSFQNQLQCTHNVYQFFGRVPRVRPPSSLPSQKLHRYLHGLTKRLTQTVRTLAHFLHGKHNIEICTLFRTEMRPD